MSNRNKGSGPAEPKSAFDRFFQAQYGKRPSPRAKDSALREKAADGREAEHLLDQCYKYDAAEAAALYAWQARVRS